MFIAIVLNFVFEVKLLNKLVIVGPRTTNTAIP